MALASLLDEERRVVEAVLWLANARTIRATGQVETRFARLKMVPGVFQKIGSEEVQAYRNDQRELRRWLGEIAASKRGRENVAKEIAPRLQQTVLARVAFTSGHIRYAFGLTGVQAVYAFGTALILDEAKGLTSRLKQCGNPHCNRFNLDFEPQGRPRRFCDSDCKRAWEKSTGADRMREWRKRNRRTTLRDE